MLIPPYRFAIVEENVYRGAYPVERNLPFLKTYDRAPTREQRIAGHEPASHFLPPTYACWGPS